MTFEFFDKIKQNFFYCFFKLFENYKKQFKYKTLNKMNKYVTILHEFNALKHLYNS